jgi:hypothetical protein
VRRPWESSGSPTTASARAQRAGTFIFAVNQRAHRQISPAQALYHCASDSAYAAAGAGDKDGALNHYAESLLSYIPERKSNALLVLLLLGRLAAVNGDRCTIYERRFAGCEEHDGLCDLFGFPDALKRYSRNQAGFPFVSTGKSA